MISFLLLVVIQTLVFGTKPKLFSQLPERLIWG